MHYKPEGHRPSMTLAELLNELINIQDSGMLRISAQDRECNDIFFELQRRGWGVIENDHPDEEGWFYAIAPQADDEGKPGSDFAESYTQRIKRIEKGT